MGSVIAVTDANGTVLGSYAYESFGTIRQQTGSLTTPWTFTGRPLDAESGLLFLRNRYYDAQTGRFLTQDPSGIQGGSNLYGYVKNNVINLSDPLGLEPGNTPAGNFGNYLIVQVQSPAGIVFIDPSTNRVVDLSGNLQTKALIEAYAQGYKSAAGLLVGLADAAGVAGATLVSQALTSFDVVRAVRSYAQGRASLADVVLAISEALPREAGVVASVVQIVVDVTR